MSNTKVTPQEIEIIKRVAAIHGIRHVVEQRYNGSTDRDEDCDCFYAADRRDSFEWCSRYDSFESFFTEYAEYQYNRGYSAASW